MTELEQLQTTIEQRLDAYDPQLELVALERPSSETLRLYIDHPDGVDLELCSRVTGELRELLEAWSLEVSSPGIDRPLTKPEHYRRFVGRKVKVRTHKPIEGRRNFTGTLAGADDESVAIDTDGEPVRIPLNGIRRSNLIPESEVMA
jgi:ribosome maturation factor RimP